MWTRGTIAGVGEILARKRTYTPPPDFGGPSVTNSGDGMFIWPLLLFVGGLFIDLGYASKQRRRAAFVQRAVQLHLTYSEEDRFGLLGYPFALFQKGDGRGIEHVLHGAWQEVDVVAFDYWYYDESTDSKGGTSRTYHRFDCAIQFCGVQPEPVLQRILTVRDCKLRCIAVDDVHEDVLGAVFDRCRQDFDVFERAHDHSSWSQIDGGAEI